MNPDTLVVVHTYQGDAHQVRNALPQYLHHECPVLVLSPHDSPVHIDEVECQTGGERGYTGQVTLDRQRAHLEILLGYPQEWFLLNDADSVCLSPDLPAYLYESPQTVFYNASSTSRFVPNKGEGWEEVAERFPVVFQPPLFFSRECLERMLAVSDQAMESLPSWAKLIDWYFVAMAREAGLETTAFPDGISRPIWATYEVARVYAMVRTRGIVMLHSIKGPDALDVMVTARAEYTADPAGDDLCAFL